MYTGGTLSSDWASSVSPPMPFFSSAWMASEPPLAHARCVSVTEAAKSCTLLWPCAL